MAEGDNRARQGGTVEAPGGIDRELGPNTVKAVPIDKGRLPEDAARVTHYATAGNKDTLPEHKARRDTYPHITVSAT